MTFIRVPIKYHIFMGDGYEGGCGLGDYVESVESLEDAKRRCVELVEAHEKDYTIACGKPIHWRMEGEYIVVAKTTPDGSLAATELELRKTEDGFEMVDSSAPRQHSPDCARRFESAYKHMKGYDRVKCDCGNAMERE